MMTGDHDERALLAAARRGLSPTDVDRARVRRATVAALAAGAVGAMPSSASSSSSARPAAPRGWSWASRVFVVGAVAAAAAGIGYGVGLRAGRDEPRAERPVWFAPRPSAAVPSSVTAQDESDDSIRVPPAPDRPELPVARAASHRRGGVAVAAGGPAASSRASLAEEVRALRSVERALREGNPGFALALLRELDRAVPNGQLVEERLATRTIARCASGDVPFGVNLADDFTQRYPESVYGRRVLDACAATDSFRAGDSASRRSPDDQRK